MLTIIIVLALVAAAILVVEFWQWVVAAARLAISEQGVRLVDLGKVGNRKFLLRAGVGLEAAAIERTPRELWGLPGLRLSPKIDIQDGLLDVFVLRRVDLKLIAQFISDNVDGTLSIEDFQHWQVTQATIQVDPSPTVQVDGDYLGMTAVEIHSRPQSLCVVVPK